MARKTQTGYLVLADISGYTPLSCKRRSNIGISPSPSWRHGMVTGTKHTNEKIKVKRYKIQHSIDEYTFHKAAYIHNATFDENICMSK